MKHTRFEVFEGGHQPAPPIDTPPIATWSSTTAWLAQLSDADLALLLTECLLLHLRCRTPAHDLLEEAIARLEARPDP